jgi:hypothetical protein
MASNLLSLTIHNYELKNNTTTPENPQQQHEIDIRSTTVLKR